VLGSNAINLLLMLSVTVTLLLQDERFLTVKLRRVRRAQLHGRRSRNQPEALVEAF